MNKEKLDIEGWASHVPLNKALMDVFRPKGVIEFGMGYNSTPMFLESCDSVVSIDTDIDWVMKMQKALECDENQHLMHLPLSRNIPRTKNERDVSLDDKETAIKFIRKQKEDHNFLFIDSISGLRHYALSNLYSEFEIVTFHDYHDVGRKRHYRNEFFKQSSDYVQIVDTTFRHLTGCLIQRDLFSDKQNAIVSAHRNFVSDYSKNEPRLITVGL